MAGFLVGNVKNFNPNLLDTNAIEDIVNIETTKYDLYNNMLDDNDVQKLIAAFRETFPTKEEFETLREEMRSDFSNLQTAVDTYARKADTYISKRW